MKRALMPLIALRDLSIRQLLLVMTAGLTLMIMLLAALDLYANAQRLGRSYQLRDAVAVSDQLFDASEAVSVERDLALAMLHAPDAETAATLQPQLATSRAQADRTIVQAFSALDRLSSSNLTVLRRRLEARRDTIIVLRPQVDRALSVAVRRRNPALAQRWERATTDFMADAEALWVTFIGPFTSIDAVATQHLRYRHMLRTITDYTGRERSIIAQVLSENANPTVEQTSNLLRDEGVLELAWRTSRLLAEQSGLYPQVAAAYSDAESHYATLHDMTGDMFYVPGARNVSYPISADLYFELASQASESLTALNQVSRAATRSYLDQMIGATERSILTQVLISLAALLLCAASFWLVFARAIRPIDRIVDALTRATRGEDVDFAPVRRRGDEINKLTDVLQAFQDNVEKVRRHATELDDVASALRTEVEVRRRAEERAEAQLERLALLHQISRAIGERQDLATIFRVALSRVEEHLPADFTCICLRVAGADTMEIAGLGPSSDSRAAVAQLTQEGRARLDDTALSRCMMGRLVYEGDLAAAPSRFARALAKTGLQSLVAAPLQLESQVFGVLVVARTSHDAFSSGECEFLRQLSEHVALAAHQSQLNAALQQAYDDLRQTQDAVMQQERLKALGQMASGIAHDINNALSPVALYTESLLEKETGLSQAGRGKLEIVQRAIDDAARTIARMNEFYRKRDAQLSLSPVDPKTLLQQVLDLTQARWRDIAQHRGDVFEMRTEIADDAPAIHGVESELREALTNLVFNAVDASPNGGLITLRARSAQLNGKDAIAIEVADNGTGMDEATRQRCLEPFFTTKGERGTGLGLAMVYGAVQRHAGAIGIDSVLGEGTTMRLTLPAAKAGAVASTPSAAQPHMRLRLLVVDDDPVLLRSLRDVLETDGHAVTQAGDGAAGVSAFQTALTSGKAFDAVITDLGMPGLDGRRVASAVKEAAPTTPVLLLTGWGERIMAEEEALPHIDRVLSKPPKISELRAALAECCNADRRAKIA